MFIKTDQSWLRDAETIFRRARHPEEFARLLCDWEPHEGQVRWLRRPATLPNQALVTGRRWGKSEVAAIDLLHYGVFHPGSRQAVVSITLDQARLSWDRAVAFASNSPLLSNLVAKTRESPFPQLVLRNGSTISVRTAAREGIYIRGHKFDRVAVDEADYLDISVIDDVIRMTLADVGGPLMLYSTPKAKRGMVYDLLHKYERGDPSIYAQTGPSFENPNVDHEYIKNLQDKMTRDGWKREILGVYADDDAAVFRWDDIKAAYGHINSPTAISPDGHGIIINEKPLPNRRYYGGADLAKSIDHTVIIVLDTTQENQLRVVYFERFQRMPWPAITARVASVHKRYGCRETYFDATGIGGYVTDELEAEQSCTPFMFTKQSKIDLLTSLQLHLEKKHLIIPFHRQLVDELQGYEWDDKDLIDTDCVMALALAGWMGGGENTVEILPGLYF